MADLALSKTLDPADFDQLAEELQLVDQSFGKDREQHPMRRWEYAMAIRAYNQWCGSSVIAGPVYDVGGAGSPFYRMLDPWQVQVIDPAEGDRRDLATVLHDGPRLGAAVFCLSVLEHVDDLDRFLYHLGCLVAPGGLLFLTFDACNDGGGHPGGGDPHHFHWMRKRIFHPEAIAELARTFVHYEFRLLGEREYWFPDIPTVYDYHFASLALVKRV